MFQDLRYAVRTLSRTPAFTAAAVLTLAAGIGLNSAIFGLFNALLFKPMPVHEPSRLVWIACRFPTGRGATLMRRKNAHP
jgi:hypothetical protein